MLMRITWENDGFYRLNIPVVPLCEKCHPERTHEAPCLPAGRKRSASSLLATLPTGQAGAPAQACLPNRQESLPELTILEIISAPQQSHGARNFNIVSTVIKGTAVSFAVFFLSFFAMNYEAYWDIAEHSWVESVRPKVMQASTIEVAEIHPQAQEKPLLAMLNRKTHQKEDSEDTLKPVTLTPPDHRLIIPKIGKNVPIVESKADNLYSKNWPELEKELLSDLKRGVVHYPGTAFPGQKGNVFLTGHSSYYPWDDGEYKDVFALLGKIEIGDEIVLFYKQKEYRYKVSDIRQVKPNNVDILKQTDDNRLTLMTCTPVGTTLRRLVITALQV